MSRFFIVNHRRAMYHPIAYTFISYNMVKRTVKIRLKDPRGDAKILFYSAEEIGEHFI